MSKSPHTPTDALSLSGYARGRWKGSAPVAVIVSLVHLPLIVTPEGAMGVQKLRQTR